MGIICYYTRVFIFRQQKSSGFGYESIRHPLFKSRAELLELLLAQTKESEQLARELEKAQEMLTDRQLQVKKAGDIAQAALAINGVMEAAQAAAQQYLDNIIRMEQETRLRCEKMLRDARQAAEQIQRESKNTTKPSSADQHLFSEIYALLKELLIQEGKDLCTLFTCTPYGINSHRLLVRGHRVENREQAQTVRVTADAMIIEKLVVAPFVLLPILFVMFIWLLISTRKRR